MKTILLLIAALAVFSCVTFTTASAGAGPCTAPCNKTVCSNIMNLCPPGQPYQCTSGLFPSSACSSNPEGFVNISFCRDCCDGRACTREPLVCDRPCSQEQCDNAYHTCTYNDQHQYAIFPAQELSLPLSCISKYSKPDYESMYATSCCSLKSCKQQGCWKNQPTQCASSCPKNCGACADCLHCCFKYDCLKCDQCGDHCFNFGDCYGECTCGSKGCPKRDFWGLLHKNVTNNFASDAERDTTVKRLEAEITSGDVKMSSVTKEILRLTQRFEEKKKKLNRIFLSR